MIDLAKYPRVWCDTCDAMKPVLFDEMPKDALNDHAAMDIQCADCYLIIATLHGPKP